jgi:hypothetical protein
MSNRIHNTYNWSVEGDTQLTTGLLSDDQSPAMATNMRVSFAWAAQDESQLSAQAGEIVTVDANADTTSGWAYCRNASGNEGLHACLSHSTPPPLCQRLPHCSLPTTLITFVSCLARHDIVTIDSPFACCFHELKFVVSWPGSYPFHSRALLQDTFPQIISKRPCV